MKLATNSTQSNFNKQISGVTHEQRMFRIKPKAIRPKSAVRYDYKLNMTSEFETLKTKIVDIDYSSKNNWKLENMTNVEVSMLNKFLKSYGMQEVVDLK